MVREAATSFKEFRNVLYSDLTKKAYVPKYISGDDVTEHKENRFFPAGTAQTVFTLETLEQLFALVTHTGQLPSLGLAPSRLAQQVLMRKLRVFLAILIISKCDIEALLAFTQKLVAPEAWTESEHRLAKLPHEHSRGLRAILGDDDATTDLFMEKQHDFFAPVIEKNQEVTGRYRRRPYVSEKLIGEGSFGRIFQVIIAPHHFRNEHSIGNDREMPLARKDFQLNSEERAHEQERDVISEIVRNAKQHKNIMKSLGSLEIGSTYSLFMPLADCDLKQYMERYPSPPSSSKQKAEIMDCAVGLAGAIVYLQDELETPFYEKLSCFHMDLKPQNILVVKDPKTGKYQWKLSDFNMSRVKMKRTEKIDQTTLRRSMTASDKVYDINKLFRRRVPVAAESSVNDSTINRRGAGTYLAPEACIDNHPVHAESDTWSLGCVISVVLSYLYGGQSAVQAYSDQRGKNGNDRFFTAKGGDKLYKLSDARVNNAVEKWHQHLRKMTKQESPKESAIFAKLIEFLDHKVLVIDPNQRKITTANEIRAKLIVAFKEFGNITDPPFVPRTAPASQTSWFGRVLKRALPEAELRHWDIPMSTTIRACAFGPSAQPLVVVTDSILTACSPKHLLLSNDASLSRYDLINYGHASPEEKSRRWIPNVGVSAQYILAATDHHDFDCYFYHINNPDTHLSELKLVAHWELNMPKIYKLTMSPDAQYAAFILFEPSRGQNSSLYITRLDWLQGVNSIRKHLSIVSSSSDTSSNADSLLGRAIPLHWPAEDVCELKFSEANILYVIVKPKQSNDATENVMHVLAWALQQGQRTALPRSPIKHDGKDDLLQSLFTSFAPFNQGAAFAIISEERTVITRACESKRFSQRHARGHRLYQLLMTQDDREILAFGTSEGRNDLQLFTFPVTTTTEQLDCKNKTKMPGLTNRSKFVPAITTTTYNSHNQRHLLVAVMEDRMVRTIRLDLET